MRKLMAGLTMCAMALIPSAALPASAAPARPAVVSQFTTTPIPNSLTMKYHDSAGTPGSVICHIHGLFTWKKPTPTYLGLDQVKLTLNNCKRQVRAWMVCVYLGAHGAHISVTRTGNIIVTVGSTTRTNCKTFSIGSGITHATLLTGRAGGLQWRASKTSPWHTVVLVS